MSYKLLKILKKSGLVPEEYSEENLERRRESPLRALSLLGIVDESAAIEAVASTLGIQSIPPERFLEKEPEELERFRLLFDSSLLSKYKAVPLYEDEYSITVAFADPLHPEAQKALEFAAGKPITLTIAPELEILHRIADINERARDYDFLDSNDPKTPIEILGSRDDHDIDSDEPNAPPIVKLANKIIADAAYENASDIHIEPAEKGLEVRFRIDGVMITVFTIPKRIQPYITSRFKLLAGMDIAEKRRPQDGRFTVRVQGGVSDLRVSSIPTAYGEKLVLRLLRKDLGKLEFKNLLIPSDIEIPIQDLLQCRGKILLVTGPTGSGKTTTLYTFLSELNNGLANIQTVEDPIEYQIPGINQTQVNDTINVTFASALRSILRQDPDVIMIGEIRDKETADIAFQAAQTGHLVLSTLHTNSAAAAITRLSNFGLSPFVLSNALGGVLAIRLVRTICSHCSGPLEPADLDEHAAILSKLNIDSTLLRKGKGCQVCFNTGYKGRRGLYSFLDCNDDVAGLLHQGASTSEIEKSARRHGFRTLGQAARDLLLEGQTSLEEVRTYLIRDESLLDNEAPMREKEKSPSAVDMYRPTVNGSSSLKQKILLVEDDRNLREILATLLRDERYEVIEAENGKKALDAVYEHEPELILSDLMMPVMDGKQFLSELSKNKKTREIPVVILTAVDSEENEIDLIELGAKDFVSKTSSGKVMLTRIRRALG